MKRQVQVTMTVDIEIDEAKFDDTFMREFRETQYNFTTLDQHIEHLAQLSARGCEDSFSTFIEGYGPTKDMGIKLGDPHRYDIRTEFLS